MQRKFLVWVGLKFSWSLILHKGFHKKSGFGDWVGFRTGFENFVWVRFF